jgi:hypothetical protein
VGTVDLGFDLASLLEPEVVLTSARSTMCGSPSSVPMAGRIMGSS